MKTMKFKIGPIILPLIVLAGLLAAYLVSIYGGASTASSLTLGQQYLESMDYSSAIAAFTQAIEADPNDRDARIGLAKAYAGREEYELAEDVLSSLIEVSNPDEEASKTMIEIYRDCGKTEQALRLVITLIQTTDLDEYYELKEEILEEIYSVPHSYSEGVNHSLLIKDGKVYSKGRNDLGQLGTDAADEVESFTPAGLDCEAVKVACIGQTSYVIDADGKLWTAGENRWGQKGGGYASASTEYGWSLVPCRGKVADVAGTTGRVLVLMSDGTLWTLGSGSDHTLRRVYQFSTVIAVSSSQERAAVLTGDGNLYYSRYDRPDTWQRESTNIRSFTVLGNSLNYIKTDDRIITDSYTSWPDGWYGSYYDGVMPAVDVKRFVGIRGLTLFTDESGKLFRISDSGIIIEAAIDEPVVSLYPMSGGIVLETESGTVEYWESGAASGRPLL